MQVVEGGSKHLVCVPVIIFTSICQLVIMD